MRWIEPGDPLPGAARAAAAAPPTAGPVAWDEVNWHALPGGELAISPRTGGWAMLSPGERATLDCATAIETADASRPLVTAAWRRGLVTLAGQPACDPASRRAEIAATRDYYSLVLLLNSGCNLACTYCYLGHAAPTPARAMPPDVARAAIGAALDRPWPAVLIDFGEIAVAGAALRELLPWAQREAQRRGKRLHAAVQTNGTTLGDDLAGFLAGYDVTVGISLDGPQDVHDGSRRFRSGAGSYDRACAAIARCRGRGVAVHVVVTVTRRNVRRPADVLAEIRRHQPASFLLKPVLAQGEAAAAWDAEGITAAEFAAFMSQAVELAGAEHLDQSARKFLLRLLGDRGGWRDSCTSRYCGSGHSLHVVSADGGLHACPRFVAAAPAGPAGPPLLQIGHRRPGPPAAAGSGAGPDSGMLAELLPAALRTPPPTCAGCSWLGSCGGGCTLAGQDGDRQAPRPDPSCTGYQGIHEALFRTVIPDFLAGRHQDSAAFNGAALQEVTA